MKNITTQVRDRASAAYASELAYAASMHFSAAHLPGGSSSSLVEEANPTGTTVSFDNTPLSVRQIAGKRSRMITPA
ncbi:MAG: hypothetical protein R2867_46955 [Caldilineaceae bacterium]